MSIFDGVTDYSGTQSFEDSASLVPASSNYPTPAGTDTLGASASIFDSISSGIGALGATVANFKNAITANNIANINSQAQLDIAKANAQAAVIKAQQAAAPQSSLMLLIAIVGVGLAFLSYAKH